jgi:ubiquinone/menaquinone biosynthesis C-methylase UbiE
MLENKFWYDASTADTYLRNFPQNKSREIVEQHLAKFLEVTVTPKRLLDVGCGDASESKIANAKGFKYVGMDASKPMLLFAHESSEISVVNGNLSHFPFQNKVFDTAISLWAIQYGDVEQSIKEIARVLKDEGKLFMVVPNPIYKMIKYSGDYFSKGPHREEGLGITRVNYYYSFSDYINVLIGNDFTLEQIIETKRDNAQKQYSGIPKENIPHDLIIIARKTK